ncbi:nucleic acid-binding protein [Aeromonas diversa CDC 2478-85]|uniref:Nucleic acid-binding protein n=1 Tax=Aeromonas diversa CDC 2478-85 TaxID=1268237 RepID=N9U5C9_9GAMM|nr:nucleotide-binding protein [Aeromonas diversa]ENY73605.1 nucleic acid-binding protein [Aeromonas diversa CDC 2478-85]
MATRKKSTPAEPKQPAELLMSRDEAKSKLQERIQKGLEIKRTQIASHDSLETTRNEYSKWNSFNTELLKRMFTTEELADEYSSWFGGVFIGMQDPSLGEKVADLYKDIDGKVHRLDSIIERLELIPLNNSHVSSVATNAASQNAPSKSKKVFVVHGRDDIAKTNLEVFLHEIGLDPVVLHRQADEGLTIIEKFEKHSDVGYAFILLTPDEVAYLKSEESKDEKDRVKEFRARPNVIFEFGYFVGKLGRSRVCCLYTGDVSLPSDVSGMIYKKFTNSIEEVAYSVIKDLKASGYAIA